VGKGPALRMQTASHGFNRMVEFDSGTSGARRLELRRKLWCMAHAKHSDGESFAVHCGRIRASSTTCRSTLFCTKPSRCRRRSCRLPKTATSTALSSMSSAIPSLYDILNSASRHDQRLHFNLKPEQIPADHVLHWFKMRRPGQHRAVPECSSTLNTGIASRRFREATLAAAETAAEFALWVKTTQQPDTADEVRPFTTWEITKRMMNFLPMGWDANQIKAEHPNATYESFTDSLINEQGRPKSMPLNKIKCNSASYNYASGRLDHQTYYLQLDVEREDCNDEVLDPLFDLWFDLALVTFGWLGGNPDAISIAAKAHLWDWPEHAVADIQTEATANQTKLRSGETFPSELYSKGGRDFEDDLEKMTRDYFGEVSDTNIEEMRKLLRTSDVQRAEPASVNAIGRGADGPSGQRRESASRASKAYYRGCPANQPPLARERRCQWPLAPIRSSSICAPVEVIAGEAEGAKKGPARFTSTFYTGGKMNVAGWDLPVVVDLAALDTAKVLVANLDHDQTKRVGNFAVANDGKSLVANGTATAKTAARDEVVESALNGYQWQSSLEVNPRKVTEVKAGKKATINGQEQEGPFYQVAGTLKGFGFVSHGADDNTTATIAATAASKKGSTMDAACKAWVETMGLDIEGMSDEQLTKLEANYKGQSVEKPKKKTKGLEKLDQIDADADRIEQITDYAETMCARNKYDSEYRKQIRQLAESAIEGQWTVDKFRLEALESGIPMKGPIISSRRDSKLNSRVIEAAICESGRLSNLDDHFSDQELQAAHDRFRTGIGLKQMILIHAEANGYHAGYSTDVNKDVLAAAFGGKDRPIHGAGFSTLDIATTVGNVANKFMMEGWNAVDQTPLRIAAIQSVRNFQTITTVSLTDNVVYQQVGADGEIKHGTLGEITYTNKADTYARMLAITRQDIINDDTNALTSVPRKLGNGAMKKLNDIFWTEFLSLVSGSFFASGNSNINTGVADMTTGGLAATETTFMNQTNPDGTPLGIQPAILLVPTALKPAALTLMTAERLITGATSATQGDANIWRNRFRVESSPYISNSSYTGNTSTAYWLLANPNELPVIAIAALNGSVEPTVETADADFNTLGIQTRGYSDVGVKRQEYRGGVHADGGSS
jgi:hypothetical protein